MSIIKCKFCEPVTDNFNILRSYLEYLVFSLSANNANFNTRQRINGKNQDHTYKWLKEFQMHTKYAMQVERIYSHSGTKKFFKIDLGCQHNTRPRNEKIKGKESCKNTDCPAKIGITIKRLVTGSKSRSEDPHLPDHPTVIQINFCHNILTPDMLKHRNVLPKVKKLLSLFKLGHHPSAALDMHKYNMLLEHGKNFKKIFHDQALLPDSQFYNRLYYKIVKKQAFPSNTENTDCDIPAISTITPFSNCENSSILNTTPKDAHTNNTTSMKSSTGSEKKNKKKRKLENTVFNQIEMTKQISAKVYNFCKASGVAGMLKVDKDSSVMALCTPLMTRFMSKTSGVIVHLDQDIYYTILKQNHKYRHHFKDVCRAIMTFDLHSFNLTGVLIEKRYVSEGW